MPGQGDGFGRASGAMRSYAQRAGQAGSRIGAINLSQPASQVGAGLPGGTAGGAATGCSLNQAVPEWGKAIAAQGGKVGSANDSYTTTDLASSDLLQGVTAEASAEVK